MNAPFSHLLAERFACGFPTGMDDHPCARRAVAVYRDAHGQRYCLCRRHDSRARTSPYVGRYERFVLDGEVPA